MCVWETLLHPFWATQQLTVNLLLFWNPADRQTKVLSHFKRLSFCLPAVRLVSASQTLPVALNPSLALINLWPHSSVKHTVKTNRNVIWDQQELRSGFVMKMQKEPVWFIRTNSCLLFHTEPLKMKDYWLNWCQIHFKLFALILPLQFL